MLINLCCKSIKNVLYYGQSMANCPSTFWARWIKQNRPGEYGSARSSIIYHRSWGSEKLIPRKDYDRDQCNKSLVLTRL
jgi:hypothetical protein